MKRRAFLAGVGGLGASGFAPNGLRLSAQTKRDLWRREAGPHLRGAVFVQRRVYRELDGPSFLGPGRFGPPVTDQALDLLAETGANLASWSGPGLRSERAPFAIDGEVEDHIAQWLERCRARGLYTTLCFRSGPGRSAFAFHPDQDWYPVRLYDASLWQSREKQDAWIEMVADTLTRFGDHPALAGVVPMEEPNGADLGHADVWPRMAGRLVERLRASALTSNTPVLFSPDRWARAEAVPQLRQAISFELPLVLHHYEPWDYTHQNQDAQMRPERRVLAQTGLEDVSGDWSVLEFGAVRHAPEIEAYLQSRIDRWEQLGANWAAFRWTSGWHDYERAEGSMNLAADLSLRSLLRRAFALNQARPG